MNIKIKTALKISAVIILALNNVTTALAQRKADEVQQNSAMPAEVKADGKLTEWGSDSLTYNAAANLFYAVSNDTENLYLTVRSEDKQKLAKIISGGISFTVNTEGKKKEGPTVTFPIISRPNPQSRKADITLQDRIASAKEIRLNGFKALIDGGISVNNEYGIKAAASLTESDHFIYELIVPLKYFSLTATHTEPLAMEIKINGRVLPQVQQNPYGRPGGYPYGRPGGGYTRMSRNPQLESEGFWIRRTLRNK